MMNSELVRWCLEKQFTLSVFSLNKATYIVLMLVVKVTLWMRLLLIERGFF